MYTTYSKKTRDRMTKQRQKRERKKTASRLCPINKIAHWLNIVS